jgi:hypothetical protein
VVQGVQPVQREKALQRQRGVKGRAGVAFAHHQAVPVFHSRVLRVVVHLTAIENSQRFRHGHGAPHMAEAQMGELFDGFDSDLFRKDPQFFGFFHIYRLSPPKAKIFGDPCFH